MDRPRHSGPDFPISQPMPLKMTDASDGALFSLEPDKDPIIDEPAIPVAPKSPRPEPPKSRRSAAWDDIANHDGPFIVPDDEDQVFAIHKHTPNPKTGREIGRIETNRKFGLTGKVIRSDEQQAMVHAAANEGRDQKEQRQIANGMSPEMARSLRIIDAIARGEDPTQLFLDREHDNNQPEQAADGSSESEDVVLKEPSAPYVYPAEVIHQLRSEPNGSVRRTILRRARQARLKAEKGFFGVSNKEINKMTAFDVLDSKSGQMLDWTDMVYESHRRRDVQHSKDNIRTMVIHYGDFAKDAIDKIDSADKIIEALEDKGDEAMLRLFKNEFPIDDWMRDYPEVRQMFMNLSDYTATKKFVNEGGRDNITGRALSKKSMTSKDEIEWIINNLGELPLDRIKQETDDFKVDQTMRLQYWLKIIASLREHEYVRDLADELSSKLSGVVK